ncbi:PREDICTED: general vesicular transport factor p115 [Diuraphis noxia]|uniref:general vesicular transport factor p115 n=1 Tax=Diuraphis noxia TaxID=143948 RepID=UPI00076384F1|nr:PREDICTED: general vesicular transport factor p115 [Diuraphis noxia]
MEYFKSGLKTVLGTPVVEDQPSGADIVERLVDRVQHSTLLADRRDACRALRALSRKYRIEVGAKGMDALCLVLQQDRADAEIASYALDTLRLIMHNEIYEEEEIPDVTAKDSHKLGERFTEIFIKKIENVGLVLDYLEEFDFHVRWPALQLLLLLLTNKAKDVQEMILVSPMGVSKLIDMLSDSREVIRNNSVLLLTLLTKSNANIQKILAFENAFDRLFDVIHEEGNADGGIVVQDCLNLMLTLLRNNISTQNFFKEGNFISRILPLLQLPLIDEWPVQRVNNVHSVLQIIRTLVSPTNPAQATSSCQQAMYTSGILKAICDLLVATGVPRNPLTEAIYTVAELIRGHNDNQSFLESVKSNENPPKDILLLLLCTMLSDKQPFDMRCAVLYVFQCYLYRNDFGKMKIVQKLLPLEKEVTETCISNLLCQGLFNKEPLNSWFSAVALSYALIDNPDGKEKLLNVKLSSNDNEPPTLLQQIVISIQTNDKAQLKIGYLMFLSTWFAHCSLAVESFLKINSGIPYFITQTNRLENEEIEEIVSGLSTFVMGICLAFNPDTVENFKKDSLRHLITKRIGVETFVDKLNDVSRNESYTRASKHPQPTAQDPNTLLLDYEFCKLFKMLEGMIMRALNTLPGQDDSEKLVTNQKQIEELNATVDSLRNELSEKTNRIEELCRLANDFRDDTDRIKTELFRLQENHMSLIQAYQLKENELESYRRLLEMHGIWQSENSAVSQQQEPMVNATSITGGLPPLQQQQQPYEEGTMAHQQTLEESFRNDLNV